MLFKRIVASTLIGILLLGTTETAFASDDSLLKDSSNIETTETVEIKDHEDLEKMITSGVPDLGVQLNDLYVEVGRNLNIDYMYVKILHLIAGGKAVYADKRPNIYSELTVDNMSAPFDIEGATQSYSLQAPWVICPDEEVERPSKYYLPDAAYSTTSDIVKLMNKRYYADRGTMQTYFNALSNDVKTNIIFCEAVMAYIGSDSTAIESFYTIYEKILYEKEKDENVLESNGDGTFTIKDKFKQIFTSNNISNERDLEVLSIILSFDSKLAASSNPDEIKEEYTTPYKVDYTSRENMMLAAMSVVGKVRYVWGGGHLSTGTIEGINPMWEAFNSAYPTDETQVGYGTCIKPTGCWCPIHGTVESANGCLDIAKTYYSVEEYVDSRKEILLASGTEIDVEKYKNLLDTGINFEHGINSHRLDGLDCSGFASWLYNQITDKRDYDSGATAFISAGGLKVVPYGSKMLPGDVFSWGEHIVVVIGPAKINSKAYVIVEATPNMVKFGVLYYGSASQSDITLAINIAREANDLIGNLPITEKTHIYNMDTLGYIKDEEDNITDRYAEIGRLNYSFLDENIVISEYNKKIKDMNAQEIIQYTIDNLNEGYVSGLRTYDGTIFDTSKVAAITLDDELVEKNEKDIQSVLSDTESTDKAVTLTDNLS